MNAYIVLYARKGVENICVVRASNAGNAQAEFLHLRKGWVHKPVIIDIIAE